MGKTSSVSSYNIRKKNILTDVSKIIRRAENAISKGRNFTFPSVVSIIGKPPIIPTNGSISMTLEVAEELSSYYEIAAYIEGEFSKVCKKCNPELKIIL